jgi:hypothetical protein
VCCLSTGSRCRVWSMRADPQAWRRGLPMPDLWN